MMESFNMAISNFNKEAFLNHQSLLMFINHFIEENLISKSNSHVVEVIRTHKFKLIRIKRKQLEEEYPLIKSYAKLTLAKQQHQCHAFL